MRYCPYCEHSIPDDAVFCSACGKKLDEEEQEPKKQSSLWGCTIALLIIALIAGGVMFTYNKFFDHSHSNALTPKEDSTAQLLPQEEPSSQRDEESAEESEDADAAEIRRRIQRIYNDALRMTPGVNYAGYYCSEHLRSLIRTANESNPDWIDFNYWVFDYEYDKPTIEQVQVKDHTGSQAIAKIAVRPYIAGDGVNIIMLILVKEDGIWLIDDIQKDGQSIRTKARRAAEDAAIQREIMADTLY